MKISQINNTNFKSGTVTLNRIGRENIRSVEAIKKIAEDKDMDIIISKNKKSKEVVFIKALYDYTVKSPENSLDV